MHRPSKTESGEMKRGAPVRTGCMPAGSMPWGKAASLWCRLLQLWDIFNFQSWGVTQVHSGFGVFFRCAMGILGASPWSLAAQGLVNGTRMMLTSSQYEAERRPFGGVFPSKTTSGTQRVGCRAVVSPSTLPNHGPFQHQQSGFYSLEVCLP